MTSSSSSSSSSDPAFLLCLSVSCLPVASRPCGVCFHLRGRVRLKPPRIQAGPDAALLFHPRGPAKWFRSGVSESHGPNCCQAAVQGTRGVHARLDSTQRRNSQVLLSESCRSSIFAYLRADILTLYTCVC